MMRKKARPWHLIYEPNFPATLVMNGQASFRKVPSSPYMAGDALYGRHQDLPVLGLPATPTGVAAYLEMMKDSKFLGGDCRGRCDRKRSEPARLNGGHIRLGLEDYCIRVSPGTSSS